MKSTPLLDALRKTAGGVVNAAIGISCGAAHLQSLLRGIVVRDTAIHVHRSIADHHRHAAVSIGNLQCAVSAALEAAIPQSSHFGQRPVGLVFRGPEDALRRVSVASACQLEAHRTEGAALCPGYCCCAFGSAPHTLWSCAVPYGTIPGGQAVCAWAIEPQASALSRAGKNTKRVRCIDGLRWITRYSISSSRQLFDVGGIAHNGVDREKDSPRLGLIDAHFRRKTADEDALAGLSAQRAGNID